MTDYAADDFPAIRANMEEIAREEKQVVTCLTCRDIGWIDNRLGGDPMRGWGACPDCDRSIYLLSP